MFDVARVLALGWSLLRALQVPRSSARRPLVFALLFAAGYVILLQAASGLARIASGTLDAAYAAMLVAVGPSFLPRAVPTGLAFLPLGSVVPGSPLIADLVLAVAVGLVSRRLADHASELPISRQDEALRWSRLSLALALLLVMQLLATLIRVGPAVMS